MQVLPALRQLQPRLYSISSSPLEAAARVQATIAVVRYESLGADRAGVCSTFVAERSRVRAGVGGLEGGLALRGGGCCQASCLGAAAAVASTATEQGVGRPPRLPAAR